MYTSKWTVRQARSRAAVADIDDTNLGNDLLLFKTLPN